MRNIKTNIAKAITAIANHKVLNFTIEIVLFALAGAAITIIPFISKAQKGYFAILAGALIALIVPEIQMDAKRYLNMQNEIRVSKALDKAIDHMFDKKKA